MYKLSSRLCHIGNRYSVVQLYTILNAAPPGWRWHIGHGWNALFLFRLMDRWTMNGSIIFYREEIIATLEMYLSKIKELTHWGRVTHLCVSKLRHQWFRWWLVARLAPSHYLKQLWLIVNWTLGNKFQWFFYRTQQFSFKKMTSLKLRPFCPSLNVLSICQQ